jgi:anaerobic magnesium-protoporphyrin IX monomethyl ester cyclase
MKILLLFPPQWHLDIPDITLPSLSAFLKTNGYNVKVKDLNIEAYDYFLSRERLGDSLVRAEEKLSRLEKKGSLPSPAQREYYEVGLACLKGKYLVDHIEEAKATLRDKNGFYNFPKYLESKKIILDALKLVSASFYPTQIDTLLFRMKYREQIDQLFAATQDVEENLFLRFYQEEVMPWIRKERPDVLGMVIVYFGQVIPAFSLIRLIREEGFEGHLTVLGNLEDEFNLTRLIAGFREEREDGRDQLFPLCDSLIAYESEHPLLMLLEEIKGNGDLVKVPNLVFWRDRKVRINEPFYIEDVNHLPAPDYSGIPLHLYLQPVVILPLRTSRGCYWGRCTFCAISSNQLRYRERGILKVVEDIRELVHRYDARLIKLRDEAIPPRRLRKLSEQILAEGLDAKWCARSRFEETIDKELCKLLKKSGCQALSFGLESASQRVLDLMDKGTNTEAIERVLGFLAEEGVSVNLSVIVGFPTEKAEDIQHTEDFLIRHGGKFDTYTLSPFLLLQGSRVEEHAKDFGIEEVKREKGDCLVYNYNFRTADGLTMREVMERFHHLSWKLKGKLEGKDDFLTPSHLYLHQIRNGMMNLRKLSPFIPGESPPQELPQWKRDSFFLKPYLLPEVCIKKYKFNILKLEQKLSGRADEELALPEETFLVYRGPGDKNLLLGSGATTLLLLCDGRRSLREIIDTYPAEKADRVELLLKQLYEKSMIGLKKD